MLKNEHEIELSKVKDENKKLNRRLMEAESLSNSSRRNNELGMVSNVKTNLQFEEKDNG